MLIHISENDWYELQTSVLVGTIGTTFFVRPFLRGFYLERKCWLFDPCSGDTNNFLLSFSAPLSDPTLKECNRKSGPVVRQNMPYFWMVCGCGRGRMTLMSQRRIFRDHLSFSPATRTQIHPFLTLVRIIFLLAIYKCLRMCQAGSFVRVACLTSD